MKEILAFLGAIPALLELFKELSKFLKDTFGDNPRKFIRDSGEAFKKLNESKTKEEKYEAAKGLQDLIKRL